MMDVFLALGCATFVLIAILGCLVLRMLDKQLEELRAIRTGIDLLEFRSRQVNMPNPVMLGAVQGNQITAALGRIEKTLAAIDSNTMSC